MKREPKGNFEKALNCKTEKCKFFLHPTHTRYGRSPESVGPLRISLKVKTRFVGSSAPTKWLEKFRHCFVHLKMLYAGAEFCILQSVHPQSKASKLFNIKYNNTLVTVIKKFIDDIFNDNHMLNWDQAEIL